MTDLSGAGLSELDDESFHLRARREGAAALLAEVGLDEQVVDLIEPPPAEMASLLLNRPANELPVDLESLKHLLASDALGAHPVEQHELSHPRAEGTEQKHRRLALVEQEVEEAHRFRDLAGADEIEEVPRLLFAALADELVDVGLRDLAGG